MTDNTTKQMLFRQEVRILTVAPKSGRTGDNRSSLGVTIFRGARKGLQGTSTLKQWYGLELASYAVE